MKPRLVEHLACPTCGGRLLLARGRASTDGEIETGELRCAGCAAVWPIRNSVPRLVPPDLAEAQRKTAAAFGWEWKHFVEMHPQYEKQFLDWIHPIRPDFFRDKLVLDAGCGIGRHAYFAATYGAREVVALDLSNAVDTALSTLAPFENAHVVQGDLLRPPLRQAVDGGGFDLVYSIGVLHHLPDPRAGFTSLLQYVRAGGTIAVWVYGHENNGFVRNVVEPLRRVTTRIPPPLLRGLAWPLALGFDGVAKGVYRPLHHTRPGRLLPLREYLASVADFSFRQNYSIVFDQLVAPTAAYIKGDELRSWFEAAGLQDVEVSHRHGNSWRGRGRVAAPSV